MKSTSWCEPFPSGNGSVDTHVQTSVIAVRQQNNVLTILLLQQRVTHVRCATSELTPVRGAQEVPVKAPGLSPGYAKRAACIHDIQGV